MSLVDCSGLVTMSRYQLFNEKFAPLPKGELYKTFSKPEDLMPQINMQPLSGNQRPGPDLPTSLMGMSLVLRLPREMHLCRPLQKSHACHRFWNCYNTFTFCSFLVKAQNPLRPPHKITIERPKVFRTCDAFSILTSKCASRHNCVHFFDISTSKSAPNVVCFADFDFAMCFALQ